jgi:hypothetical protein
MGQLKFAANEPAITASPRENVVRFDPRRRVLRIRWTADAQPRLPEAVVVPFSSANETSRQGAPRAEDSTTKEPEKSSGGIEARFTTLDFVATAFLILSVFTAPALVWTMLRSASLG